MSQKVHYNATSLAAAVIRQAVVDLEDAYSKVQHWDRMAKEGRLREWVKKKLKQKNYKAVSFTPEDKTALQFLKEGSSETEAHQLMFSITDVDGVPPELRAKRDWLEQNIERLQAEITRASRGAKRDIHDENI